MHVAEVSVTISHEPLLHPHGCGRTCAAGFLKPELLAEVEFIALLKSFCCSLLPVKGRIHGSPSSVWLVSHVHRGKEACQSLVVYRGSEVAAEELELDERDKPAQVFHIHIAQIALLSSASCSFQCCSGFFEGLGLGGIFTGSRLGLGVDGPGFFLMKTV